MNLVNELEYFFRKLNNSNISIKKANNRISNSFKITLETISKKYEDDEDRCIAIVQNINGPTHQCLRKKKFGHFCGLHNGRKNSFKTIYDIGFYDRDAQTFQFDLYFANTNNQLDNHFAPRRFEYKGTVYYIDNSGDLYYETWDGVEYLSHINESNIPLTIY